ncbi:MAG TPA: D-alanine--D-alanine ligase family protein [Anaerolineales bacterium]|nr:D-alanine--D-alanine ligase family protein [Anaerolineales bacterium]
MTDRLRVGVLFGGRSGEHEISLLSARSVLTALDPARFEPVQIGITHDGRWYTGPKTLEMMERGKLDGLSSAAILADAGLHCLFSWGEGSPMDVVSQLDVVFPVLHGSFGEDGTIQGLLELADVPYVGAGVLASSVAMDKALFKELMRARGLPVLDWVLLLSSEIAADPVAAAARGEQAGPYPLFTKPANLGSSVGVSKVRSRSDLIEGLMDATRYDRRVIVERGLEAREIEVSVLGNETPQASIPGEIVPSDEFYSYRAKYLDNASELRIPAPIDERIAAQARRLAVEAFVAIDGAGMARADFLLDKRAGDLYLNELNTIPGFTKISMYPKLWDATGLPYPALMERLIELALERQAQKDRLVRRYGEAA